MEQEYPRHRGVFSEPLSSAPPQRFREISSELRHMARGLACAIRVLIQEYGVIRGHCPRLMNERRYPLCGLGAPMRATSFMWSELIWGLDDVPPEHAVLDVVVLLVSQLRLTLQDLVLAFVIFESCLWKNPLILRRYTFRPLLLSCCAIALKVCGHTCPDGQTGPSAAEIRGLRRRVAPCTPGDA